MSLTPEQALRSYATMMNTLDASSLEPPPTRVPTRPRCSLAKLFLEALFSRSGLGGLGEQ
ncbi:MAG: hypothetical protein EOM37_12145 [Proteobacteria bacterium]|nr:hypothetical protein [Pseudomonadota bacterium]